MAAKTLVKEVTNKGNMVVLLNLQQMGLIFKNYLKKDASCSSLFTFEKMAIGETRRRREFQESLKKTLLCNLVVPSAAAARWYSLKKVFSKFRGKTFVLEWLLIKNTYLVCFMWFETILSTCNFFAVTAILPHAKIIALYSNFKRERLCLQPSFLHRNIHFGAPCRVMHLHGKNRPGKAVYLTCKSKMLVVKNISLSREGIIFTFNQKCIF